MDNEEQKYIVGIGLRNKDNLITSVCQDGASELFENVLSEKKFSVFYCSEGDKTLVRVGEVCFLVSKKVVGEPK